MTIVTADDLTEMEADVNEIISDRPENIIIRRGGTALATQTVRIERTGGQGQNQSGQAGEENRGKVVVLGKKTLNIQPGDVFNDSSGVLYRVILVRPNRQVCIQAEAEVVE